MYFDCPGMEQPKYPGNKLNSKRSISGRPHIWYHREQKKFGFFSFDLWVRPAKEHNFCKLWIGLFPPPTKKKSHFPIHLSVFYEVAKNVNKYRLLKTDTLGNVLIHLLIELIFKIFHLKVVVCSFHDY